MKVSVKVEVDYSHITHRPIALVAVYRTNKSLFKKKVDIIRQHELTYEPQEPFLDQLERFVKDGNMEDVIMYKVKKDIINKIEERSMYLSKEERMNIALNEVKKLKLTFEFDENLK